jgi:predicted RNase H-like nuclease (RuvC/YqgF family)
LVSDFIQTRKKLTKDKKNKEFREEIKKLEKQLKEKDFKKENIEKIIDYCKRFVALEQQLEQEKLQTNIEIPANK